MLFVQALINWKQELKCSSVELFFPVSRQVQINFIFPDSLCTMYIVFMLCMQKIIKFTHTQKVKTLDISVEFLIGCLEHGPCMTSVYISVRHRVPVDFICLTEVQNKANVYHIFI